jgi:hypothetical protein
MNGQPVRNILWGSALMTTVPNCAIECGRRWEGKTPKNDLRSIRLQLTCTLSIMKSLSWHFAANLCVGSCHIPGTISRCLHQLMPFWISTRSLYYRYPGVTCPFDAHWVGVRSKSSIKCSVTYISCFIWSPGFEWWILDASKSARYPLSDVLSWPISKCRPPLGICLPFTYSAK